MKKIFSIVLAAAAILTACERFEGENATLLTSFTGTIVPATRTTLVENGEGYLLNWVAGDRIVVSNGASTAIYEATSGGSATTTFTPVGTPLAGTSFTAFYPETLAEGILSSTQDYAENDIIGMPMAARSGDDPSKLEFSPASGILKVNVATQQSGLSLAAIRLEADQPLSGTAVITNGTIGVTEGSGLTLWCGDGVALGATAKPFFIHIPAGSYTGLKVTLVATDGKEAVISQDGATVFKMVRGQVNTLDVPSAVFSAPTSQRKAVLRPGSDVNELMKLFSNTAAKSTSADKTIKKIAFQVNRPEKGEILVSEADAEPVWISFDKGSGTVTFTTRADEIYANVNMGFMFSRLHALTEFEGLEHLNTSETEYFSGLFRANASAEPALTSVDFSCLDTRNVVSMASMFDSLVNLKSVNLSGFNTAKCKSFSSMFNYCRSLESVDLSHFQTSECESMYRMFRNCESLTEIDLRDWDLSKVSNMNRAFQYCVNLKKLDLSGEKCSTESITDATYMVNASNRITEMRLSKNFLLENFSSMPEYFYPGIGYILTTVDDPMVIYCTPDFAQKSLRTSIQALRHTNDRVMVWKNTETGAAMEFDQPVGSMTNTVSVVGASESPKAYFDVSSADELTAAIAQVRAFDQKADPVIRLNADIAYDELINTHNEKNRSVTLDLNGHILSTTIKNFITVELSEMTITDSGSTKGKITSSESIVCYVYNSGTLNLKDCHIESTKPLGESWSGDAILSCVGSTTTNITGSVVEATGKLTVIRINNSNASVFVDNSDLATGTKGEEGFYGIANLAGNFTMNSGSIYTKSIVSGTAPSALHHGGGNAISTVNGGYLYSAGERTVSAGGTYMPNITLNGCYLDKAPSPRPTGENVTYGSGKSLKAITPVTQLNPVTGETLSYGFKVE